MARCLGEFISSLKGLTAVNKDNKKIFIAKILLLYYYYINTEHSIEDNGVVVNTWQRNTVYWFLSYLGILVPSYFFSMCLLEGSLLSFSGVLLEQDFVPFLIYNENFIKL